MALSVSAISKKFGQNWVLKDVSFHVQAGHIVGLCGPAGAGKSTLLSILAGRTTADSGSVDLDGERLASDAANLVVFGNTRPRNWLASIFGSARHLPAGDSVDQLLKGLLGSEGEVFLLDDVFSRTAPRQRSDRFNEICDAVRRRRHYVLFATADFGQVLEFCDSAVCLRSGEVLQSGTPEQLYLDPANSSVAGLTGRINLFPARRLSSSKADVPEFQTIDGAHRLAVGPIDRPQLGAINQNMTLAVRPEHVSISFGASFPEDNLIKAGVVGVRFLGPMTLVELDADGLKVEALVRRLVGLRPGDECLLGMPPDRIMVFRD